MKNVTLQVEGMSCQHCVRSIQGALRGIGTEAKVNLTENTVEVAFDENAVAIEQIKSVIEEQGYDVV